MRTTPIVVGTDGTAPSEAAVRWAAREAARRETPLRIVYAYPPPPAEADATAAGDARQQAGVILDAALLQARAAAPYRIAVELEAVPGEPVAALLGQPDAEALVLGNRGRGGFASLLLGSVSQRVATHAEHPVVVVRGRTETASGPIVAGVDDSDAADGVLEAAFEAADTRGAPLAVVRTYAPPTPLWVGDIPAVQSAVPEIEAEQRRRLEQDIAPWREKFPEVDAEAVVSPDGAAAVLVAVSHSARMMVVGSRGHGTVANTLLGSTGLQLLHHSGCPVLIVRSRRTALVAG
ncbi:universal stress protein [Actinoplanes sp. NBRC 14428]|uniref:Nucleotide-binding universal stress UspA family protein n=1 Tax=Pseudosporangium ferrugineum TaxID=439699 RepID=A0A2T0SI74_9ACTN|nr:universal stress protein [Pseudosporangium ferrugineum]PRY33087.1 nucleotide-binding universal stress UspA family protein [Pseudosporangium ferrugineum]BCJ48930.1 universal stress protein [Actinoplanes sp. NBRC 14428]